MPLIELLKNYFQFIPQDDERTRREKITGKVLTLDRSLEDTLPYLFSLLGLEEPSSSLQQMDPQIRRRRMFEAIKRLLMRESLNQPLILVFEDLHWLDNETQAFLVFLGESVATARMLLLMNYRPEYRHDWGNKTYYTQLRLDPLGKREAEEMLSVLLEEKVGAHGQGKKNQAEAVPLQNLKQFILEKTEGNPFFMEEIVQALHEQGILTRDAAAGTHGRMSLLTNFHLPTTVQGILVARIDRLPPDGKELLQTMAVIGKEFPLSLLRQVVNKPEEILQQLLSHLQQTEFIYEQPVFPEVEYIFKHALTQEVAYGSVLQDRRRVLHEHTAQAIEALYHTRLEDRYGDLAHHYSHSRNTQKAIEYLRRAGQQAVLHSAYAEAISHLISALELLKNLSDTPERTQQELAVQTTLGAALLVTRGPGAVEAEKPYIRARELCQQIGDASQLFLVLRGLRVLYTQRGGLEPRGV